jgi:nitrous oxidase accessory protein NosD
LEGAGKNTRDTAVQMALDSSAERVLGMAEAQFPWAREAVVREQRI